MQPGAGLAADLRDLGQRIDRPGARAAAADRYEQRPASGRAVGFDCPTQRDRIELEPLAHGEDAHLRWPEAEHTRGAGDRGVRLVGQVRDEVVGHRADERLPCAREGRHVGGRAPADEDPRGGRRVADPLLEPVEHLELDLRRPCGLEPRGRVDVRCARDEVAQRARPRATVGDEREEPGMIATGAIREDVAFEAGENLGERRRAFRRRAAEQIAHLARCRPTERRRLGIRQVPDEHVDRAVAGFTHLVGGQLQLVGAWIVHGGSISLRNAVTNVSAPCWCAILGP